MEGKSLINRNLDFWLIGGFSVGVWIVTSIFQHFRSLPSVNSHFVNIPYLAASLVLVCNYPHFAASYSLAYLRGASFIKKNSLQLIVVPLLLLVALFFVYLTFNSDNSRAPLVLNFMIQAMFFTVGWHYTKQSFGCMMVYAHFDGYKLTNVQRNITRYAVLGVWWVNFIAGAANSSIGSFYGASYKGLGLPVYLVPIMEVVNVLGVLAFAYFVVYKKWVVDKQKPSANFLIPYIAVFIWWFPLTRQLDFYMYLTPFFHSLQYLPFVYKIDKIKVNQSSNPALFASFICIGLVITGWLFFEGIPNVLDQAFETGQVFRFSFFLMSFNLFINLHHYFIDNTIWKFKDPNIKNYLLA